jgi:SOS response regulatory protein OraA/RecX
MLASREMSASRVRARLAARGYDAAAIDHAVARLLAAGALDDERAARACARTLILVKRRGPQRARRELEHMGFAPEMVAGVLDELLNPASEQHLLDQAVARAVRGRNANINEPAVFRRVQAAIIRRGFGPSKVRAALLARLKGGVPEEIDSETPPEDE